MIRPCTCDRTAECRLCWLYHHNPSYRELWGGPRLPTAEERRSTARGKPKTPLIEDNDILHNLEHRLSVWNSPGAGGSMPHDLVSDLTYPFEPFQTVFVNRDVLEIGPGRGRQYEQAKRWVKSYSICDISEPMLWHKQFSEHPHPCVHRLLLKNYAQDFGVRFDIVHFWYVVHHVPRPELHGFFRFVRRHLTPFGMVAFNTPQIENWEEFAELPGDGLNPTRVEMDDVMQATKGMEIIVHRAVNEKTTGDVFLFRETQ